MNKKYYVYFIFLLLLILFFTLKNNDKLAVHFLDVGQGDAILIMSPSGQNILIDGGPDNNLLYQVANKLPWWERTIDYLVITHYHEDHYLGFLGLIEKYKVKNILITYDQPDDELYKIWTEKLKDKNINPKIVRAGERFVVDDYLNWQILLADGDHEDLNENSIVIKLSYKETDFLFMGDLPTEGEEKLLASALNLDSEILKVAHHGSKYSSSKEFLEAISPEICIIQSGKDNKFGHPHQETIEKLKNINCNIKNTQYLGAISLFFE